MLFLKSIVVGIGFTLGLEIALGLRHAIKVVMRSKNNERR